MGQGSEARLHPFIPSSSHSTSIWVPALGTRESKASPGPCPALRAPGETDVEPLSEINVGTEEGQDATGDTEVAPRPALGLQPEDRQRSLHGEETGKSYHRYPRL